MHLCFHLTNKCTLRKSVFSPEPVVMPVVQPFAIESNLNYYWFNVNRLLAVYALKYVFINYCNKIKMESFRSTQSVEWDTLDNYERAGTVLNYIAALTALLMSIFMFKSEDGLSKKKLMYVFLFIFILVTIGNTAFVVKTS